jgi:hypothetical protein
VAIDHHLIPSEGTTNVLDVVGDQVNCVMVLSAGRCPWGEPAVVQESASKELLEGRPKGPTVVGTASDHEGWISLSFDHVVELRTIN